MSQFAIDRTAPRGRPPTVIVEADGLVIADVETWWGRHAEPASCDLALPARRADPAASVVFHPRLKRAACRPGWGRTRQSLDSDHPLRREDDHAA